MALRLMLHTRQHWITVGGRVHAVKEGKRYRALDCVNSIFNEGRLREDFKVAQDHTEYWVTRRPKRPAWEYTPFAQILHDLEVPKSSNTNFTANFGPYSSVSRPTVVFIPSYDRAFIISNNTTQVHWIASGIKIVGQLTKYSHLIWRVSYNHDEVLNATRLELAQPTPQRPYFSPLIDSTRARRVGLLKEQISSAEYELNRAQQLLEQRQLTLKTAIGALESFNSARAPRVDTDDERVAGAWTMERPYNAQPWIVVLTKPLTCRAEFDNGATRQFNLGPLTICISWSNWTHVFVTTRADRQYAHPHTNGSNICLGPVFATVASELQKRGDFGLYLTLLLDHLQEGIDTNDSLGGRVVTFPEVKEVPHEADVVA